MMENSEIECKDIIEGRKKFDIVDKLEDLRSKLSGNSLTSRYSKKELLTLVDEIIDSMPVEFRTARWIVREQESYIVNAKNESQEILNKAKIESDRLIEESYVLQEAVIEANTLIKQAEIESQNYRSKIEDEVYQKIDELNNKISQLAAFLDNEKKSLKQPRNIDSPE